MGKRSKESTVSELKGCLFECEVLGAVFACVDEKENKYVPYRQTAAQAKTNQPSTWDPTDPPTGFANDLHAHVAIQRGLDDWSELKIYTSVGQALDIFHGVDALFEYAGNICPLDLTMRNKAGYKADMEIITLLDFESSQLRCLAGDIALRLKGGVDVVRM